MKALITLTLIIALMSGCAERTAGPLEGEWVDLSHDFGEDTIYWVTAEPFKRTTVAEGVTDKGYYYSAYNFSEPNTAEPISILRYISLKGNAPLIKSNWASWSVPQSRSTFRPRPPRTAIT
jgi:hypothetical protein